MCCCNSGSHIHLSIRRLFGSTLHHVNIGLTPPKRQTHCRFRGHRRTPPFVARASLRWKTTKLDPRKPHPKDFGSKDGGAQPIHRCRQTANCHPHLHQWHHLRLGSHSQKEKAFQPTWQLSMETTLLDPQWQYPGHLQFRSRLRKSFVHRREQTQREH